MVLMTNFKRNNLDKAISPYLQQHKGNPIWWQEWSQDIIAYAKKTDKIVFASVGYATCHWCHVMAREAFSDKSIAEYFNSHFVCIKVDREQRPDIDAYLMSFIQETQGYGGWPLNVFLTPDLKPFFAATYVPIKPWHGMPAFLDLLKEIKSNYEKYKNRVPSYQPRVQQAEDAEEEAVLQTIKRAFTGAGFGDGPQFPAHSTLLFLFSYYEETRDREIKAMLEKILDTMAMRGLHDHLQGGFYRYCVDTSWTIPHFEKMLYDQAMLLWVYSVAFRIFKTAEYERVVQKLLFCLEETYAQDGLYVAAHDADTDHQEGMTYLWEKKEIQDALTGKEFERFAEVYDLKGNFEGKIHLIKKKNVPLPEIEKKLLQIRKSRPQPFTDKKIVTSWNALVGIGFVMAYRALGSDELKEKARSVLDALLKKHYHDGMLCHSSHEGKIQNDEFLEDYASMLLFVTYLSEETKDDKGLLREWHDKVNGFHKTHWVENKAGDFMEIPAASLDHPTPSSVSLAEMALLRARIILGKEYPSRRYKQALAHDFFNLTAFIANGNWHVIQIPSGIEWKHLPVNCIQGYAKKIQECYKGRCSEYATKERLLDSLNGFNEEKVTSVKR